MTDPASGSILAAGVTLNAPEILAYATFLGVVSGIVMAWWKEKQAIVERAAARAVQSATATAVGAVTGHLDKQDGTLEKIHTSVNTETVDSITKSVLREMRAEFATFRQEIADRDKRNGHTPQTY